MSTSTVPAAPRQRRVSATAEALLPERQGPHHTPVPHLPPQHLPPQHLPPQHLPPQHLPPQHQSPQHQSPQHQSPRDLPPQRQPSQRQPSQRQPARDLPPRDQPPRDQPPRDQPPRRLPPQHLPPQHLPPKHLKVVRPPSRRQADLRRRRRLLLGLLGAVLAAAAFGLVYLHVVLAQRQFGLDVLSKKVTAEAQQYQRLRLQVARLEAPARIIAAAEGQLGMREPASVTYLAPSGPAPAAPVTAPGSATTSGTEKVAGGGPAAPAGDADWPVVKSLLAGSP